MKDDAFVSGPADHLKRVHVNAGDVAAVGEQGTMVRVAHGLIMALKRKKSTFHL